MEGAVEDWMKQKTKKNRNEKRRRETNDIQFEKEKKEE